VAVKNVYIDGNKTPKKITGVGYNIIWAAYEQMWNTIYDEATHIKRAEFIYVSEIDMFKEYGHLPEDFNWEDYKVK